MADPLVNIRLCIPRAAFEADEAFLRTMGTPVFATCKDCGAAIVYIKEEPAPGFTPLCYDCCIARLNINT